MFPVKAMLNVLALRVYVVQDDVCVPFVRSREHNHFKVLVHHFQYLLRVWTNIEASLEDFATH